MVGVERSDRGIPDTREHLRTGLPLDRHKFAVRLTNTTHFLRPITSGTVTVDAVALNQGRTQQLWRVESTDQDGRLLAQGQVRLANLLD